MRHSIPIILLAVLVAGGCRTQNVGDKTAPFDLPSFHKFDKPIDLTTGRLDFLESLATTNSPAAVELLRQHLYDDNLEVRATVLRILDERRDVPSALERYILKTPTLADDSGESRSKAKKFLENIRDLTNLQSVVFHAQVKTYRPEFPYLSFYSERERMGHKKKFRRESYRIKTGQVSGGRSGIVGKNRISFAEKAPARNESGWRRLGGEDEAVNFVVPEIYPNEPFSGAWCRSFKWMSTVPVCYGGQFFMGDGLGNLVCGDMRTGRILWQVRFPLPPYAQLSINNGILQVKYECDLQTFLVSRFHSKDGKLIEVGIQRREPDIMCRPSCKEGDRTIQVERKGKSNVIICSENGTALWTLAADCTIEEVIPDQGKLYVLGHWSRRYYAIACLEAETGKIAWASPLVGSGPDIEISHVDQKFLWVFDDDSVLMCIDKETGKTAVDIRFSSVQYSMSTTGLSFDKKTNRLLIDPSYGVIYSLPKDEFLKRFALKTPLNKTTSFGHAFRLDVVVAETKLELKDKEDHKLFAVFANEFNESKFSRLSTRNWRKQWDEYVEKLVTKAKEQKLDAAELRGCLAVIAPKADDWTAKVPVNAFRCKYEGEDAWAIVCKWEYGPEKTDGEYFSMSHVQMRVISVKTKKILMRTSCG